MYQTAFRSISFLGLLALVGTASVSHAAGAGFVTKVTVTPSVVKHGKPVAIAAAVTANSTLKSGVVDIEIYDAAGKKAGQAAFQNTSLWAHDKIVLTHAWTPNQPGKYTIKLGIFSGQWKKVVDWDNTAATFTAK